MRGRKRKNGKRNRSGRLVQVTGPDRGTPEMQQRRTMFTKDQRLSPDYPLSILLGHELITQVQHDAGMLFARNYWALFGKPFGQAQDYQTGKIDGHGTQAGGAIAELHARSAYECAVETLAGMGCVSLVVDLAVFLRPGWLVADVALGRKRYRRHQVRFDRLREALQALAELPTPSIGQKARERCEAEMAA